MPSTAVPCKAWGASACIGRRLTVGLTLGGPPFDHDVLPVYKAELAHALQERRHTVFLRLRTGEVRGRNRDEENRDPGLTTVRLPLTGERRCEETTGQRADEGSPCRHWITSSARASSDGGIVRPSALAVLRLMARSNLADCCTGRSAGFMPFRILST